MLIRRLGRMVATVLDCIGSVRVAVVGGSMEPSLLDGDRLLVSRFARRGRGIHRGAIILVRERPGSRPESIKRVVGMPGDRVRLTGVLVAIDGVALIEPYLVLSGAAASVEPAAATGSQASEPVWQLGADEYFVLGDRRARSTDSRGYGPVRRSEIIGVAWYRYAPPQRRGRLAETPFEADSPARRR